MQKEICIKNHSINGGNIDAAIYYCKILLEGKIVSTDINKAKSYLENYLESNNSEILNLYGQILQKQKYYTSSLEYYERSSKLGNIDSIYNIGILYQT
ncbi:hypothetical protein M9Y10_024977 [Tritrichomonas musculus]|uniref:Uncharacterized protein n=1 Tax=Tritrichomonas musculus TaxID=1915356 RepID=A0ABR2HCX5_9EUKA